MDYSQAVSHQGLMSLTIPEAIQETSNYDIYVHKIQPWYRLDQVELNAEVCAGSF